MHVRGALIAALWLAFFAVPAEAHRYVPNDGTHGTYETALFLDDVSISQVAYHSLTPQTEELWLSFDARENQAFHVQMAVPEIERLRAYTPMVILFGPGLPDPEPLPATAPSPPDSTHGARVFHLADGEPERFYEPFTGTASWIHVSEDLRLPAEGRYYLVLFAPEGEVGKAWVAVGRRERFTVKDIVDLSEVIRRVRDFHEVADEPMPFLPGLLTAFSDWLRRLLGPLLVLLL